MFVEVSVSAARTAGSGLYRYHPAPRARLPGKGMKKTAQPRLRCAVSSQMTAVAGLRLPAYFHPHGRAARRAHAPRSSVHPEALRRAGAPRFRPCRRVRQAAGGVPQGKSATLCLGKGKKNEIFLSSSLALHHFGSAQDRLRLGKGKKNEIFLSSSLALHYLCRIRHDA